MKWSVLVVSNKGNVGEVIDRLSHARQWFSDVKLCRLSNLPKIKQLYSKPDVLLIDETAVYSVTALRHIVAYLRKVWPETRTMVMGDGELERMIAAARGDSDGYVPRYASIEEIAEMFGRVARGEDFVLPPSKQSKSVEDGLCLTPFGREYRLTSGGLTPREREITNLIAEGMTNRELSDRLNISIETAKWHVKNALRKLGLRDRTELAIHWHCMGQVVSESHWDSSFVTC